MKHTVLQQTMRAKGFTAYRIGKMMGLKSNLVYHVLSGRAIAYPKFREIISSILGEDEENFFTEEGYLIPCDEEEMI